MNDASAIGIRIEQDFLKKIEKIGKDESVDRSTVMRLLLEQGYRSHVKKKAMEKYILGRITMGAAAKEADLTTWEFEQYLVSNGYRSQYSVENLKEESDW